MKTINESDLKCELDELEKLNYDYAIHASLFGNWKEVYYYKGFESCICCLKDYLNIEKNVDIYNLIRYL